MNLLNYIFGMTLIAIAIVVSILTGGVALPFMLPIGYFGLTRMGIKTE